MPAPAQPAFEDAANANGTAAWAAQPAAAATMAVVLLMLRSLPPPPPPGGVAAVELESEARTLPPGLKPAMSPAEMPLLVRPPPTPPLWDLVLTLAGA